MKVKLLSCVQLFGAPWTVAYQAPLSMGLQARILEWVTVSFSRGSSQPRDRTWISRTGGRCLNLWATREAPEHNRPSKNTYWMDERIRVFYKYVLTTNNATIDMIAIKFWFVSLNYFFRMNWEFWDYWIKGQAYSHSDRLCQFRVLPVSYRHADLLHLWFGALGEKNNKSENNLSFLYFHTLKKYLRSYFIL